MKIKELVLKGVNVFSNEGFENIGDGNITNIIGSKLIKTKTRKSINYENKNIQEIIKLLDEIQKKFNVSFDKFLNDGCDSQNEGVRLFYSIYSFIKAGNVSNILFFSSPENGLHPTLQYEFGKIISKLNEAINLKIVLYTYSPFISMAINKYCRDDDSTFYYSKRENGELKIEDFSNPEDRINFIERFDRAYMDLFVEGEKIC